MPCLPFLAAATQSGNAASALPGSIAVPLAFIVPAAFGVFLFRPSFTGVSAERALLTFAACWLFVLGVIFFGVQIIPETMIEVIRDERRLIFAVKATVLILFAVPFALRLHSKWLGEKATAAEMEGGAVGVRVWLSAINCAVAIVVAVMTWLTFDISLVSMLMLTFALLLAFPVIHGLAASEAVAGPAADAGGIEREKVLAMLESGHITAEESAELFNALAISRPLGVSSMEPLTPAGRLMMIGACLVLVGFLFPWFSISPAQEMGRALHGMRDLMGGNLPIELTGLDLQQQSSGFRITVIGAEVQHGWGWMVLVSAMTSALLPVLAKFLDQKTLRLLRLLTLGVGTIVLLSVVGSGIRWISFGLVAVLAGYAMEWLGLMRERAAGRAIGARSVE